MCKNPGNAWLHYGNIYTQTYIHINMHTHSPHFLLSPSGSHLGLVIEFQADSSSNGSEGEEFLDAGEVVNNDNDGSEDCHLDGILSLLASQDLDSK